MRIAFKQNPKTLVTACAILALMAYLCLLFMEDGQKAYTHLTALPLKLWVIVLSLIFASYILRFWRWQYFLFSVTKIKVPLLQHFSYYLAGFAFTLAPAKIGEGLRAFYLKKHQIEINKSLAIFVVERLQDMILFILLASFILFEPRVTLWGNLSPKWHLLSIFVFFLAIFVFFQTGLFFKGVAYLKSKLPASIAFTEKLLISTKSLMTGKYLATGLAVSALSWGLECLSFNYILQQLGQNINLFVVSGIFAISILAGVASFMPGGLGGAEAAMIGLLVFVGVPLEISIAATVACRFTTLWFAIILGAFCVVTLHLKGVENK